MAGDGRRFVRGHDLVVVSFNYRLGALGFLAVPGESPTGSFGLHDQIAALRWVRENIGSFGGDPEQVTVYGLSAGTKSVAALMASPLARGLFARAASSSGGEHVATPAQAAVVADRFFRELGTGPERVRDVSAGDILAAQSAIRDGAQATWLWRPAIDGAALPGRPLHAIARGRGGGRPAARPALRRRMRAVSADRPGRVRAGRAGAGKLLRRGRSWRTTLSGSAWRS
jgi:para-nitrobenzyl esterase